VSTRFTPFSIIKALPARHPLLEQCSGDEHKLCSKDTMLAAASKALQGRTCKIIIEPE
jgi:hypothetical protein